MVPTQIRELIAKEVGDDVDFAVQRPPAEQSGQYGTNVALVLAGQRGSRPMEVAEGLAKKLRAKKYFAKVEVAQPGFINFFLDHAAWEGVIRQIIKDGKKFGTSAKTGRRIEVEFISGNPTGPLTLANGRGGFGGDVLARVLERMGHTVEREYYLNDTGYQIEELGAAIKGESDAYKGPYVKELRQHLDTAATAREVGKVAARQLTKQIKQAVTRMNIHFDTWFSEEQEIHLSGRIEKVLEELAKAEATYEQDGALWLKTTDYGDQKDRVIRKSSGDLTYLAADLAHYFNKMVQRKLDEAILIVGPDHHGYVDRIQAGVEQLRKIEPFKGQSRVLVTQVVRLVEGDREVKMSKRAGTYVALDDLLDQVPVDVARFFFVMKSFDTHMDFDLDLAKEQSPKNPVYYLKYAHARIAGILKKAGKSSGRADLTRLTHPAEIDLIKDLSEFLEVVRETAEDYQVQRIAHYGLDLADTFHKFYEQCQVNTEPKALAAARLKLVEATKVVLGNIGDTLGIEMPDRM